MKKTGEEYYLLPVKYLQFPARKRADTLKFKICSSGNVFQRHRLRKVSVVLNDTKTRGKECKNKGEALAAAVTSTVSG